jgi:endonuclease/exonuclease/phosphatase family metal-dependent hydrolase
MVRVIRLSLLTACLAAACTAAKVPPSVPSGEPQAKSPTLRVMTYNIKHGQTNAACTQAAPVAGQPPAPDCNLDLQASIGVMRSHNPDILGVQEVDRFWARSGNQDEPAVLAAGLGMAHSCYGANLDHPPDTHATKAHQYGTVILSRFPIDECTNTLLPKTGSNEQRGLTLAVINVRGVRLRFYNAHLHTTAADRLLQAEQIAKVIDAAPAGPTVLTGDFNARPTTPELVPMYARFGDAWQKAGTPAADNADGLTSPARLAGNPTSRIDYVFASSQVSVESAAVPIDAQTRVASDHFPVVVTIGWQP